MDEPIIICLDQFIRRFFTDISDEKIAELINEKLIFFVFKTYFEKKPTNSLDSIAKDFYNCLEPTVCNAATITASELSYIILYIVILTTIFMILIAIILSILDKKKQPEIVISIVIFFALLYIIIGWMLIQNNFLIIYNEINNIQNITNNCFQNTLTELEIYFKNQELAVNDALCDYPIKL